MTHDELASSLAAHLRGGSNRITWEDLQLGPSGSPRPDVYSMERTYTRLAFEAFECKVSVADFRADVTAGKWQSYLRYANSVTFAVPAGLIDKSQVPATAGLIICGEAGKWKYVKRPVRHALNEIPWQAWAKLLMDGVDRSNAERRAAYFNEWLARESLAKKFGDETARLLHDIQDLPARLARESSFIDSELKRGRERADKQLKELAAELARDRDRLDGRLATLLQLLEIEPNSQVRDVIARVDRLIILLSTGEHRYQEHPFERALHQLEHTAGELRKVLALLKPHPEAQSTADS